MNSHVFWLVSAACLLLATGHSAAQDGWRDIYNCGSSKGQSFYLNGEGWQADGISKGVIVLRKRGADEFDVLVGDASGASFSARGEGAGIIGRVAEGTIQILVVYPTLTVETYLFSTPKSGRSTLAWTSSKQAYGLADRASVFVSSCILR